MTIDGLTNASRATALDAILPNATTVYVALMVTLPDLDGSGGTEVSTSGYARIGHSTFVNVTGTGLIPTRRANSGLVEFLAFDDDVNNVKGWAMFDAVTAGNMIAFGAFRDTLGNAIESVSINAGDNPRFQDQQMKVG